MYACVSVCVHVVLRRSLLLVCRHVELTGANRPATATEATGHSSDMCRLVRLLKAGENITYQSMHIPIRSHMHAHMYIYVCVRVCVS